MTQQHELALDAATFDALLEENGEDAHRTVTCVVTIDELVDGPETDAVTWHITFPALTPEQIRCWGEQFLAAAGRARQ